ncbi:MAG: S-methyl-5'-thioinosine phosphorylase [Burkholderiales bacterium]
MLAIIGGSGLDRLSALESARQVTVSTPYGKPSAQLVFGRLNECDVVFLARHGEDHRLPPHKINYRANVWALHAQGVKNIVAVATVGGIGSGFGTGTLAIPDQILDYTWGRASTFFDGESGEIKHIDFTQPYCESMRATLVRAAQRAGESMHAGGTYAATQGPRLESAAEITKLARDGADMVGMTGMPEAALARELGLCYATLAVVVNAAAGTGTSAIAIDLPQAESLGRSLMVRVVKILEAVASDGN